MDNPDLNQGKVKSLILLFRKITRFVQLTPFAFLFLYALSSLLRIVSTEILDSFIDVVFYTSPAVTISMLFLSRFMKLCRYHKIACLLPSSTKMLDAIDNYVMTFTWNELAILYSLFGVFCILFLYQSHKIFFGDGRKEAVA